MKNMKRVLCLTMAMLMAFIITGGFNPQDEAFASEGFTLTAESRIFISNVTEMDTELIETVKLADSQFAAEGIPSDQPLEIVYGPEAKVQAGDIVINVSGDADSETGRQSYGITENENGYLEVYAFNERGLLYAMNTLLKKYITDDKNLEISDRPYSAERTILLDCGRKYYSRQWIENLIKRMSWQKYTSLELHFSETHGMRLESKTFPWLNEPEGEYLTYEDLESICETANKYQIEIIPDMDTPGHMDYIVQKYADYVAGHPDFSFEYDGKTYDKNSEGFASISNYYMYGGAKSAPNNAGIDISSETALAFTNALIDEYADFFAEHGSTKFNIGGDELFGWVGITVGGRTFGYYDLWSALEHWEKYARNVEKIENGSAADAFIAYLNNLSDRLNSKGYTCRVWNDEIHRVSDQHIELNDNIEVVYWSNDYYPMSDIADAGYKIYNTNTGWCYYVIREDKKGGDIMDRTRKRCNAYNIYENWNPRNCANPKGGVETLIPEENFGGGYFAIWADNPEYKSQETVFDDIEYRTWANVAKLWNPDADDEMGYKAYKKYVDSIGKFPGFSGDCMKDSNLPESPEPVEIELGLWERIIAFFKNL